MNNPGVVARFKYYDLIMASFVAVLLISNVASSAKIVDWGITVAGIPLAFDAGTLLFPISYIFADILTEVYGYSYGRRVIWIGFASAILMSLTLWIVGVLPGEAYWAANVGQQAYHAVLGGLTTGAIVIASLVAYWGGEFSNSFVLAKMKILTRGRWLWSRTIGSTLVGEGVDTVLFVSIATLLRAPGFIPDIWLTLILANYLFKCGIEILMTPFTYKVVNGLKRAEKIDFFDHDTLFNPFKIS